MSAAALIPKQVFPKLPLEVETYLYEFLDAKTFALCATINRTWADVTEEESAWLNKVKGAWFLDRPDENHWYFYVGDRFLSTKQRFKSWAQGKTLLNSAADSAGKVRDFLSRVEVDHHDALEFTFLGHPRATLNLELSQGIEPEVGQHKKYLVMGEYPFSEGKERRETQREPTFLLSFELQPNRLPRPRLSPPKTVIVVNANHIQNGDQNAEILHNLATERFKELQTRKWIRRSAIAVGIGAHIVGALAVLI